MLRKLPSAGRATFYACNGMDLISVNANIVSAIEDMRLDFLIKAERSPDCY